MISSPACGSRSRTASEARARARGEANGEANATAGPVFLPRVRGHWMVSSDLSLGLSFAWALPPWTMECTRDGGPGGCQDDAGRPVGERPSFALLVVEAEIGA
ncbi:MAG: hypothetical protein HYY06_23650 [Deltaproteobacteria bacterium]|nr:hypothetical protein [Deltaproteobacteria bacterium]